MESANDLNPCPFCGGKAEHFHRDDSLRWGYTDWIACVGELPSTTALFETKQEAVIAWNTRADLAPDPLSDPRVKALVEAVEEGVKAGLLPKSSASDGGAAKHSAQVRAADRLRTALKELKGQDDE